MTVTYVSAAERDRRRARVRGIRAGWSDVLLLAASCAAVVAIGLAYRGRLRAFDQSERERAKPGTRIVNLNTVASAADLESLTALVRDNAAERQLAARQLFQFLLPGPEHRRALANVGAILAARNPSDARPVFSSADLAAIKPYAVVRTRSEFRRQALLFTLLYLIAFQAVGLVWHLRGVKGDRLLLAGAHLLTAIGFAILLSRSDPLRDLLLFVRYSEGVLIGLALLTAVSLVDFRTVGFLELSYIPLLGALSLCVLVIAFGDGPGSSNAKVNLGPLQPIEAIRLLLACFLSGYFARRWEVLRGARETNIRALRVPQWLNVPRAEYVLPVLVGVATALLLFFLQKDLGPALFVSCVFLAVYAVARGRVGMAVVGFLLLVSGFYIGYRLNVSTTLAARVRMWQSPWDNAVPGGDQVAHAVWALATGGTFGSGFGLGDSQYLPAGHTDLVLAAVGEELGIAGLLIVALAYAVLTWRSFRIARGSPTDYGFFLATALALFLIVPVLIMAAGVLGVVPLTGVVTPFLSYGGSAMAANFAAVGMLSSIHADPRPAGDFQPFRLPLRWLVGALTVCAVALIAITANVQVVHADDYLIRPHLGVQADGGRRYEYNPRVLDVVRRLPRGTVYDRRGLPLATEDAGVIAGARSAYEKLGISVAESCPNQNERCYPLAGRAFHLLGDARTRANWTASNTSYVERDAEDTLRGFNDHAQTIEVRDTSGRPTIAIRRDYRDLIPLVRHRHEPTNPSMVAFLQRDRDLHLSIDAALQARVASILAAYGKKGHVKAAAVVLDPDSGALLASASYPWPEATESGDPMLDRARYGLYPPGSTFKLVTASAALRQNPELCRTRFTCSRLADGRIGTSIQGWHRPIRDDVLDSHPHGTIDMHDAIVHSCNAYFANLAVKLGPQPLLEAGKQLGISLTPAVNVGRRMRETLPQVGYGQGDVVATPLRMARIAAAIASGGALRETQWKETPDAPSKADLFLTPDAARLLGGYMRDVVLSGTGHALKNHPSRIAGKTGTAEITGAPSHAWFVGFAPYGAATRRIAFAVILEHAGYGGANAAPVAGDIVTAAAQAGLIE
jgi:cell division protein FtsW (lipid II flippase)